METRATFNLKEMERFHWLNVGAKFKMEQSDWLKVGAKFKMEQSDWLKVGADFKNSIGQWQRVVRNKGNIIKEKQIRKQQFNCLFKHITTYIQ